MPYYQLFVLPFRFALYDFAQCFGRIDVGIDKPLSIREFLQARMPSVSRPLASGAHDDDVMKRVSINLGYRILWGTNNVAKILPTSLVGTLLLTQYERGIAKDELVRRVHWLQREVVSRGSEVVAQEGLTLSDSIKIVVDRVLVEKTRGDSGGGHEELVKKHKEILLLHLYSPAERMELSLLRNQLIHVFQSEGILACSMYMFEKSSSVFPVSVRRSELLQAFQWLSLLLAMEFIYDPLPGATVAKERFDRVLKLMCERGVYNIEPGPDEDMVMVRNKGNDKNDVFV